MAFAKYLFFIAIVWLFGVTLVWFSFSAFAADDPITEMTEAEQCAKYGEYQDADGAWYPCEIDVDEESTPLEVHPIEPAPEEQEDDNK